MRVMEREREGRDSGGDRGGSGAVMVMVIDKGEEMKLNRM